MPVVDNSVYDANLMDRRVDPRGMEERMYDRREELRKLRRRTTIRVFSVVMLILVVCLFIGARRARRSSDSGRSYVPLAPAPHNLPNLCSDASVASQVGFVQCEEACEAAECCDFPVTFELSCLQGNEAICLDYHPHCSNLSPTFVLVEQNVPTPPANLEDICSQDSVATVDGFTACHQACSRGNCCYDSEQSCATQPECDAYAVCLTLTATEHVHSEIQDEVEYKCHDIDETRDECERVCSHAICCNPYLMANDSACDPLNTPSYCSQYEACHDLWLDIYGNGGSVGAIVNATGNTGLVTAEEIQSACVDAQSQSCADICDPGFCCFDEDENSVCEPEPDDCIVYEACEEYFLGPPSTLNTGEGITFQDVQSACSASNVGQIGNICQGLCAPADCCFDEDTDCPDTIDCDGIFAPCSVLYQTGTGSIGLSTPVPTPLVTPPATPPPTLPATPPPTPSPTPQVTFSHPSFSTPSPQDEIEDACLNHSPPPAGQVSLCQQLCQDGECCFNSAMTCSDPSPLFCATYASCFVLYLQPGQSEVEVACADPSTRSHCIELCAAATCCFATDPANSCVNVSPGTNCQEYEPCDVLYS